MARAREDRVRQQSYRVVLSTTQGQDVFDDLVTFSQQCADPIRALGRADVVLRFLREKKRASETKTEEE